MAVATPFTQSSITEYSDSHSTAATQDPLPSGRSRKSQADFQKQSLSRFESLSHIEIKYIDHPLFSNPQMFVNQSFNYTLSSFTQPSTISQQSNSLSPSLLRICETKLLDKEEEQLLFQRFNFHKSQASLLRDQLCPDSPDPDLMDSIDEHLHKAKQCRDRIMTANMRLVISVVKKFLDAENNLDDLVSEGSMSLIRAIDNFDFSRGFRFSTYATYAIRRNFYRYIINARKKRQRVTPTAPSQISENYDVRPELRQNPQMMQKLSDSLMNMIQHLDKREREVIIARFGISKSEDHQTLQTVALRLGVCKERIRQLEKRALRKLQKLSIEFELDQFESDS